MRRKKRSDESVDSFYLKPESRPAYGEKERRILMHYEKWIHSYINRIIHYCGIFAAGKQQGDFVFS